MPKTLTLRVDDATYEFLAEAAEAEGRSIANLIETAALAHLAERQFADDAEVAEIAARERLRVRLARAAAEARARRGEFID